MGGIKNRDEKRKAAKVFSSGGGGGAKGPSVIDKRGQEEKCPHCDRVFKQNSRLKEHVARQHTDVAQPQPDPQAAQQQQQQQSGTSTPNKAGSCSDEQGQVPIRASSSAAAGSSKAFAGSNTSSNAKGSSSGTAAKSSSSSSSSTGHMFDVGSKGGFYTEKSPKLLLHEWCMQQKRPKPKYKAVPLEEGQGTGFRARVVLPDSKHPGSDKDVVVWLDREHAAAAEEEGMQRAAVAALVAVAGERSYDYLLPQRYKPLWGDIKDKAQARAESQARAAAAAAERKAKQAAIRAAYASRAPVAVVMSEKQRVAVEDLMQELALGDSSSTAYPAPAAASLDSAADAESSQIRQEVVDSLVKCGFSAADSAAAVQAVGTAAGREAAAAAVAATAAAAAGGRCSTRVWRGHAGLQPYLDWLCLHLPVERLPSRYRPGGSSGTVGVLRTNNLAAAGSTGSVSAIAEGAADGDSSTWQDDPHVLQLVQYGYPADYVMAALQSCGSDIMRALHHLQQQLLTGSCQVQQCGSDAPAYVSGMDAGVALPDSWTDEVEVLAAIYGDELDSSTAGALRLQVDGGEQVPGQLVLYVWCPCGSAAGVYPDVPPLVALSSGALPGSTLLALTARLAAAAKTLAGNPMVHELAVMLAEELEAAADQTSGSPLLLPAPAPFDQPLKPTQQAAVVTDDDDNGYTAAAQQHAAAAEALMGDDDSSTINSRSSRARFVQQPRHPQQWSPERQAAESRRLAEHYKRLQVSPDYAALRATRIRLPAYSCRQQVLDAVSGNNVVVISGATGCGKSTQVPQYLFEDAVSSGNSGFTNIIICQPRRIAAVGLATRVADEVGDPAGVGGLVGYSVRLDSKVSAHTRLLFCTTGVLLRRLMGDPQLTGVSHVVLDEVHERNLESDLLLLLLRRSLLAAAGGVGTPGSPAGPKLLLMSATADAELFADYFAKAGPEALLMGRQGNSSSSGKQRQLGMSVGMLSIPGLTHPVRQLWLEDALQQTGVVIGKQSRYAKRKTPKSSASASEPGDASLYGDMDDLSEDGNDDSGFAEHQQQRPGSKQQQQQQKPQQLWSRNCSQHQPKPSAGVSGGSGRAIELGMDAPRGVYSEEVLRSIQLVDPALINYELIEALLLHIVTTQRREGPAGLLKGWENAPPGALEAAGKGAGAGCMGAVLVFMPGAPEIDRLVRQLKGSSKLATAAGKGMRVLPLHGGLPASVQSQVFERPPPGVVKVVVATNVAETSLTIDDVTVVIDTGRHKEMSYDSTRGLSCLKEAWVSKAAAQQRKGRAGRVAPGTCYRLWPGRMWCRLAPQQAPEVLRVPLQQLCLTTKASLAATGLGLGLPLGQVLSCLLTPPSQDVLCEAISQLSALGALDATDEALTALGSHLAAMPMDAQLGKAVLYGSMLRCASPLLTIAAALGHGRPLWINPPPDKRAEVNAARRALAPQAYSQRSDHLSVVAAYNGWIVAKASGGRRSGTEFAQQHFISEQVLEAIAKGRLDYASTLAARGFLPDWYVDHLRKLQQQGPSAMCPSDRNGQGADMYGAAAVSCGGPDEYSYNARIVKAAICAGFYPRILRVEAPTRYQAVSGGAMKIESDPASIKFFERNLGRVWIHPASVCFEAGSYPSGWMVFTQLLETSRAYVREASMVPLYALLAFGGQLEVLHDQGLLLLDGWAKFKAPARVGVLIKHLRAAVASLMAKKITDPTTDFGNQRVVQALHALLVTDGF